MDRVSQADREAAAEFKPFCGETVQGLHDDDPLVQGFARHGGAMRAQAPFSSYPEDRAKLLDLARKCEQSDDADAVELGDLVRAILEDEEVTA